MSGYSKPVVVSPFPYYSGVLNAPQQSSGVGIWYAYFESTLLTADGQTQVVNLAGIGTSGNAALFESVGNGVQVASQAIVQATAWGLVNAIAVENKWLGIQMDKQGTLLVRAHTAFNHKAANITYGGVLAPDDILRVVGCNESPAEDYVLEGWISVIATPI